MRSLLSGAFIFLAGCLVASASTITFVTPTGSTTSGGPVDASATITTGAGGAVTITLTNLEANPKDVAQLLSDLSFDFSGGETSGTLTSSSGTEIKVAGDGTFTTGSTVPTGWALSSTAGGLELDVLGTPTGPKHLIIGPAGTGGTYSNAKGSIAGNKPHNPFLDGAATFNLDVPGVTVDTTVTN